MNHYAGSMLKSCGGRHYWFADHLRRAGYRPVAQGGNAVIDAVDRCRIQTRIKDRGEIYIPIIVIIIDIEQAWIVEVFDSV